MIPKAMRAKKFPLISSWIYFSIIKFLPYKVMLLFPLPFYRITFKLTLQGVAGLDCQLLYRFS